MVCDKCRYVNKTGAEVCKHCGASLLGTPEAEHTEENGDIEATRIYTIKSAPRILKVTKVNITSDTPAPVKTVSFKDATLNVMNTVPREYGMEASDEGEPGGDAKIGRRNNIKFITIISALVIFVAAAVVAFLLLLNQTGKSSPTSAAAPAASDISSIKPSGGQAAE